MIAIQVTDKMTMYEHEQWVREHRSEKVPSRGSSDLKCRMSDAMGRTLRLLYTSSGLPPILWFVLGFLGVTVILLTYFLGMDSTLLHVLAVAVLTAGLTFTMFTTIILDQPLGVVDDGVEELLGHLGIELLSRFSTTRHRLVGLSEGVSELLGRLVYPLLLFVHRVLTLLSLLP
jgi:hypothetical protein